MIDELSAAIAAAIEPVPEPEGEDRRDPHAPRSLRGVRGVPGGKLAALIAEAYRAQAPTLPADGPALDELFGRAWEDGLAAIGLCATCVRETPAEALALGLGWAERTDDVATADALGWLVLGPAAALGVQLPETLERLAEHARPETRRAAASMALAFTPEKIEGPAAAGLREQVGERQVRMVETVVPEIAGPILARFVRDDAPAVQKALRRVVRAWAADAPESLVAWAASVRGGIPRLLGAEVDRVKPKRSRR